MNPAEFHNIARSERDFWWYRGMRGILARLIDPIAPPPGSRVLEAGCGTGYQSKFFEERYHWRMVPTDLGRGGLDYARGYGLHRLVQADMTSLPFAAASFDAVVSLDAVVHLPLGRETSAFHEFARVLLPGGLLILRVAALPILRSRHSEFAHERQRFTRERLVFEVEGAGFRCHRVSYANTLLLPVALAKFRIWEPLVRAEPASGVQSIAPWLDRLLSIPLRLEESWIGAGGSFPVGQSLLLVARREH